MVACLNEAMEAHGLDMRVSALVCFFFCSRKVVDGISCLVHIVSLLMFVCLR